MIYVYMYVHTPLTDPTNPKQHLTRGDVPSIPSCNYTLDFFIGKRNSYSQMQEQRGRDRKPGQ